MALKSNDSCLAKCAEDEPIFVLRAQDATAVRTIQFWIEQNINTAPASKIIEAHNLMNSMLDWQQSNRVKVAD